MPSTKKPKAMTYYQKAVCRKAIHRKLLAAHEWALDALRLALPTPNKIDRIDLLDSIRLAIDKLKDAEKLVKETLP